FGGRRDLTPFLDRLATESVVFTRAYATCSWTSPSVASLFTSRYPSQTGVMGFDSMLRDEEVTLAETLTAAGDVSVGMSGNMRLASRWGFAQGFRTWGVDEHVEKLRGAAVRQRLLARLDRARRARPGRPVFLYVQYMDPHSPYAPPPRYRRRFERRA